MSNLQIGLAVAGGLVLAAVVAHGAWTSRKNTPRQPLPDDGDKPPSPGVSHNGDTEPGLLEPGFDPGGFAIPLPDKKPGLSPMPRPTKAASTFSTRSVPSS